MEYYKLCQACGKGFTYTDEDLKKSMSDAKGNILSAVGSAAGALSGNWGASIANQQNYKDLRDFTKCPHCGSTRLKTVTLEEFQNSQKQSGAGGHGVQINQNATVDSLLKRVALFLEDKDWSSADLYCNQILDQEPENPQAYVYKLLAEYKCKDINELSLLGEHFDKSPNYSKAIRFADEKMQKELSAYAAQIDSNYKYRNASSIMKDASGEDEFLTAAKLFGEIPGFKDSNDLYALCLSYAEDARKKSIYEKGKRLMQSSAIADYKNAITEFESISGWADAAEQIDKCKKLIEEKTRLKKRGVIAGVSICLILILAVLAVVLNNKVLKPERDYKAAQTLYEEGRYREAIEAFSSMDYKDSHDRASQILIEHMEILEIGEHVNFGDYGGPIEWVVLDKNESEMLLITQYVIDAKAYNDTSAIVTWENCSLRKWLNSEFVDKAFTEEDKARICDSNVTADKDSLYDGDPGNDTVDKVFLLSAKEVKKYFSGESSRQCTPTKYAEMQGALNSNDGIHSWWWLRTCGDDKQAVAANIKSDGSFSQPGGAVENSWGGVRPAMWIRLDNK